MLEFASDGESILYSSGAMDGSDGEFAPDLWRYHPSTDEPELLWRNPRRDRSLVKIGGEFGTWAFVDMPLSGEIAWDFWLIPEAGADPILLDSHPGPGTLPDFVPSFHVHQDQVAWTAFDLGPNGEALSRLLYARAPDWTPVVVAERDARLRRAVVPIVARHAACLLRGHLLRRSHDRRAPRLPRGRRPPRHPSTAAGHVRPGDHADPAHQRRRGLEGGRSRFQHVQLGNDVPLRRGDRRGHSPADAAAGVRELPVGRLALHRRLGRGHARRSASTTWTWTSPGSSIAGRPRRTSASCGRTTAGSCSCGWRRRSPATTWDRCGSHSCRRPGPTATATERRDQGRVMRMTSSASSSCSSVRWPSSRCPRSTTTWRIGLRSASACLAMLAASS